METSQLNGETVTPKPVKGKLAMEQLERVTSTASTPPAAVDETFTKIATEDVDVSKLKTSVEGIKSSPLEGHMIAPFIDLTNCTKANIPWRSVAARAIMRYAVKDFTVRNFEVDSWPVDNDTDSEDESDSECEDFEEEDSKKDKDALHTRLDLGMGIHEGEFKGEKIFLELRFIKDGGPKSFMTHCGIRHNKFLAVYVEGLGRGSFIQEFLEDVINRIPQPPKRSSLEFQIYRWDHSEHWWRRTQRQKARDLKSVILPKGLMERIEGDMAEFLSPETAKWYDLFGIPYKRSYLFHGVPGTGKTSLITALAGKLERNVCFLSAHHPEFSDDAMKKAMEQLPRNAFLIMEDIDSLFNQRKSMNNKSALTFTGLLNCLDGIGHATGQIVIMTTNYVDRLDEALIRAGRADMWVEFKHSTDWQLGEIFKWFYHRTPEEAEKWKDTFIKNTTEKFPHGVTIAEMQQHFVDHRTKTAQECAENVKNYDMPMRKFMIGKKAEEMKKYQDALEGKTEDDEKDGKEKEDKKDDKDGNDESDDSEGENSESNSEEEQSIRKDSHHPPIEMQDFSVDVKLSSNALNTLNWTFIFAAFFLAVAGVSLSFAMGNTRASW